MTETNWTRREFLRRAGIGAAAVAVGPGVLAACSKTSTGGTSGGSGGTGLLAQAKKRGYITVGFANEAPYGFLQGGKLVGEAPAVHGAIWKALGINQLRGVNVDFGALIPGLNAGRFDAVAAGMFILPDRCKQAAFSDPVYQAPEDFMVKKGNPFHISTFQDIAKNDKITLGVLSGASEGLYAKQLGVPAGRIKEVASQEDGLAALTAGRIDAFSLTSISLNWLLKHHGGAPVELTKPFVPVIKGKQQIGAGAAVFRKDENDLRTAFNQQLSKLRQSGELLKLIQPWGFGPETIPPASLTTAKLCQAS